MEANGNCYQVAANIVIDNCFVGDKDCEYILVHAEVMGQSHLEGVAYGHAYVVDTRRGVVIEKSNGLDLELPRQVYELIGRIREINNFYEYTPHEAREKLLEYGHYGPWDLETSTGL